MTRESVRARLNRLEEELGSAHQTGTLTFPNGLELDSVKGKAWLAANLPNWPVVLVPERVKDIDEWRRLYAHDDVAE